MISDQNLCFGFLIAQTVAVASRGTKLRVTCRAKPSDYCGNWRDKKVLPSKTKASLFPGFPDAGLPRAGGTEAPASPLGLLWVADACLSPLHAL